MSPQISDFSFTENSLILHILIIESIVSYFPKHFIIAITEGRTQYYYIKPLHCMVNFPFPWTVYWNGEFIFRQHRAALNYYSYNSTWSKFETMEVPNGIQDMLPMIPILLVIYWNSVVTIVCASMLILCTTYLRCFTDNALCPGVNQTSVSLRTFHCALSVGSSRSFIYIHKP